MKDHGERERVSRETYWARFVTQKGVKIGLWSVKKVFIVVGVYNYSTVRFKFDATVQISRAFGLILSKIEHFFVFSLNWA